VNSLISIDDLLNRAFLLACFIQGDKENAIRIVTEAMAKLEVAMTAQDKRLYYRPAGRSWMRRSKADRFRNKVSFNELHLLQRLVYIESEPYEEQQERASGRGLIGEAEMLIHFIKHLVKITIKRNSFYVTLGLSRLLYNYTTAETMEVYNAVIQDPERMKDDYYFRSRKVVLMKELKERFGHFLEIGRGPRGEERFRAHAFSSRFVGLVRECFSFFTPWQSPCSVPAGVDPIGDGIPGLSYQGHQEEDKTEVNRIHAVLHPECYERLVKALGFAAPDERLEVPHFFLSHNESSGEGPRSYRPSSGLNQDELLAIKGNLEEQAARRKKATAGLLRVMVDGTERARLDPNLSRRIHFDLDRDAELIEIRAGDGGGDLLLASHLFAYTAAGDGFQPAKAKIRLEGGQQLSIVVSPGRDSAAASVEVAYQETSALRAASLFLRRMANSEKTGRFSWREWGTSGALAPTLAVALIAICVVGITQYKQIVENSLSPSKVTVSPAATPIVNESNNSVPQTGIAETGNAGITEQAGKTPGAEGPPSSAKLRRTTAAPPQSTGTQISQPHNEPPLSKRNVAGAPALTARPGVIVTNQTRQRPESGVRGFHVAPPSVRFREVKKIFVDSPEDGPLGQRIRESLISGLKASNRLAPAQNRDEADARLIVSVVPAQTGGVNTGPEKASVVVQLVNARGEVIWPLPSVSRSGEYQGVTADVTTRIVRDLLSDIQRAEQQR